MVEPNGAGPSSNGSEVPTAGTWSDEPGPRGCHTRRADGELCGAIPLRGQPFCRAHSGTSSFDARAMSERSAAVRQQRAERRAALKLVLGSTSTFSTRGALRAQTLARAAELATRAVDAALDPSVPGDRAVRAIVELVDAAEPRAELTLTAELPSTLEQADAMSLNEIEALARAHGFALEEQEGQGAKALGA